MLAILLLTQPGYLLSWTLRGEMTAAGMSLMSILITLLLAGMPVRAIHSTASTNNRA